ncbi:ABC transporter substrate-binding protein [Tessaracoccus antarcticus]|uniref:ABC transporter substrate-binding protein n=1 Tax=Tessaracoccus antarcticus TaxID=2479848 RepID=A0A3M0GCZ1_9ACTN|nr:ABC transporter substrate-binding protein [Tessaracoccus antarcticus]RMB58999.1 ABC transporter substrate-binding protein [Tessaracoccus antarcticus]
MNFSRSVFRVAIAGTALALSLTACSSGSNQPGASNVPNGAGKDGPVLQVYRGGSGQFVENYNPLSPTVLKDVDGLIYERLFFFDNLQPLGTEPTPELGKSYKINDAGTVVTVQLQEGVKWSDGEPFTAKDVAYTFNTMRDNDALNRTGNTPKAEATSDTEVTLTFDAASFGTVPTILGSPIVPEHIFSKMADITTDTNLKPVGTGPMKPGDFTAQSYTYDKSDTFREADKVVPAGLRYYSLSGNEAATNKLLAGELDWAGINIPDVEKVIKSKPDLHLQDTTNQQVILTTCSNAKLGCTGPQTSPAVRHAMAAAMDRDQINKLAYFGRGVPISPTFGVVPRDNDLIDKAFPTMPMTADPAKAKSLLEADGWKMGSDGIYAKGGERLSMAAVVTSGYTDYISALEVMKQQFKEAGIEIVPQQQANAEVTSARGLGKFQVAIDSVFDGPVADPYYIYSNSFNSANLVPVGESGNPYGNTSKFSNPEVDAAVQAAGATQDVAEKAKQYAIIQKIIVEDMPLVPIINNKGFVMYNDSIYTGWKLYAAGGAEQTLLQLKLK